MIVYAEREEVVQTADWLRSAREASDPVEREIRFGQFESGVVDAICPDFDDLTPVVHGLREIAITREYERVPREFLPGNIRLRPPEGFAYYALYPEMYASACLDFLREQQPARVGVVGIRSIGTTLSAVVARTV